MMLFGKFREKVNGHRDQIIDRIKVHASALPRHTQDLLVKTVGDEFFALKNGLDELEENIVKPRPEPSVIRRVRPLY